ncbi:DUF6314 family protein [Marivita sp. S2033]|uniref:DUF6314 family protein n=1 Tax=Marivita sp. S2033 TaxID=3373187 RepID=UPI003982440A
MSTPPTLGDFTGAWQLSRTITDDHAGSTGRFDGTALFEPDASGLRYFESGTLCLAGQMPLHAERRYHWADDGASIAVSFADGTFFHRFTTSAPEATHWCDPDTYAVSYDFTDWPRWRSTWSVSGPRKSYRMITFFTRA